MGMELKNRIRLRLQGCGENHPTHFIVDFVKEFNAELDVLNVDYHNKHFKPETPEQSLLLHTMLEEANPSYHFIEHADIEDGINEFAEKNNLDLIITIPKNTVCWKAFSNPVLPSSWCISRMCR